MYAMTYYKDSSCVTWPVDIVTHKANGQTWQWIKPTTIKEPLYVAVISWDNIECVEVTWRSWAWQVQNCKVAGRAPSGVRGFVDTTKEGIRSVKAIMAEAAFWQLERNQVLDIAEHLHLTVEHHMTLFDILYTMVKQILKVSAEVVLTLLRKRIIATEKTITHSDVLLEMDEASACLVGEDRKQVVLEQTRQQVNKVECKELRRGYGAPVVSKVHGPSASSSSRAKSRPEFVLKYPQETPCA